MNRNAVLKLINLSESLHKRGFMLESHSVNKIIKKLAKPSGASGLESRQDQAKRALEIAKMHDYDKEVIDALKLYVNLIITQIDRYNREYY